MNPNVDLIDASQYGDLRKARSALKKGAGVDAKHRKRTALQWATQEGHISIVKLLVKSGSSLEIKDENGFTALHIAVGEHDEAILKFLISAGADVNTRCRGDGDGTPLHTACSYGYFNIVRILLANGVDVNAEDDEGHTPFDFAKDCGKKNVINILKRYGAQPSAGT